MDYEISPGTQYSDYIVINHSANKLYHENCGQFINICPIQYPSSFVQEPADRVENVSASHGTSSWIRSGKVHHPFAMHGTNPHRTNVSGWRGRVCTYCKNCQNLNCNIVFFVSAPCHLNKTVDVIRSCVVATCDSVCCMTSALTSSAIEICGCMTDASMDK